MTQSAQTSAKGALVARILAGAWRNNGSGHALSESQLDVVTPLLCGSGGAGLGWWNIRKTLLSDTSSGTVLQQAYRLQALQASIHEQKIKKVFSLLRQAGIEPILVKGWAAARTYPNTAVRAYGDIDLLVRAEDFQRATNVLTSEEASDCWVDLHKTFSELAGRRTLDLFARSRLVDLDGAEIRVLSNEDHLALLAIHLLKHGAWRPLWLCDIAVSVESIPEKFAWDVALGAKSKQARWILCVIGLAHQLLEANLDRVPRSVVAGQLPGWLVANVLKQWERPYPIEQSPMRHPRPMQTYLRQPLGLFDALRSRWPDPIGATISVNGGFNELPRLPYQLGNCVMRATQLVLKLPLALVTNKE